jgi:hypothetical protein
MIQEKGIKKYQNLLSVAVLRLYASDVEIFKMESKCFIVNLFDELIDYNRVLIQSCISWRFIGWTRPLAN